MARKNIAAPSVEQIISDAVQGIVARTAESIQRAIGKIVATQVKAVAPANRTARRAAPARGRRGRPARGEITKWVADNRARRVPTFVIEMTGGLDTKKKIVAKFGDGATFEKGKPLPKLSKAA
jgi:hypothetical protein